MKEINFDNNYTSKLGKLYANYLIEDFKVEIIRICKLDKHNFEIAYGEPVFCCAKYFKFSTKDTYEMVKNSFYKVYSSYLIERRYENKTFNFIYDDYANILKDEFELPFCEIGDIYDHISFYLYKDDKIQSYYFDETKTYFEMRKELCDLIKDIQKELIYNILVHFTYMKKYITILNVTHKPTLMKITIRVDESDKKFSITINNSDTYEAIIQYIEKQIDLSTYSETNSTTIENYEIALSKIETALLEYPSDKIAILYLKETRYKDIFCATIIDKNAIKTFEVVYSLQTPLDNISEQIRCGIYSR